MKNKDLKKIFETLDKSVNFYEAMKEAKEENGISNKHFLIIKGSIYALDTSLGKYMKWTGKRWEKSIKELEKDLMATAMNDKSKSEYIRTKVLKLKTGEDSSFASVLALTWLGTSIEADKVLDEMDKMNEITIEIYEKKSEVKKIEEENSKAYEFFKNLIDIGKITTEIIDAAEGIYENGKSIAKNVKDGASDILDSIKGRKKKDSQELTIDLLFKAKDVRKAKNEIDSAINGDEEEETEALKTQSETWLEKVKDLFKNLHDLIGDEDNVEELKDKADKPTAKILKDYDYKYGLSKESHLYKYSKELLKEYDRKICVGSLAYKIFVVEKNKTGIYTEEFNRNKELFEKYIENYTKEAYLEENQYVWNKASQQKKLDLNISTLEMPNLKIYIDSYKEQAIEQIARTERESRTYETEQRNLERERTEQSTRENISEIERRENIRNSSSERINNGKYINHLRGYRNS